MEIFCLLQNTVVINIVNSFILWFLLFFILALITCRHMRRSRSENKWHKSLDFYAVETQLSKQVLFFTACSQRCKMPGIAIGLFEKLSNSVQFYLNFLRAKMSRRRDGDQGLSPELLRRRFHRVHLVNECAFVTYLSSAHDVLKI